MVVLVPDWQNEMNEKEAEEREQRLVLLGAGKVVVNQDLMSDSDLRLQDQTVKSVRFLELPHASASENASKTELWQKLV
jgi:hypothetical protein